MAKKWGFPDQWSLEEKVSKREDEGEKSWKTNKRGPGAWRAKQRRMKWDIKGTSVEWTLIPVGKQLCQKREKS